MNRDAEESLLRTYRPWDIGDVLPWKMQTWNSDLPIFEELIKRNEPDRIIEVGSWLGGSAIRMAQICQELGLDTKIICIDTWLGENWFVKDPEWNAGWQGGVCTAYRQFASNVILSGFQDVIVPFPQTSALAAIWMAENDVKSELVYIDGGHDRDSVMIDCRAFWPLCTGTLFGDDFRRGEVGDPVRSFAAAQKIAMHDRTPHWVMHKGQTPAQIRQVQLKTEALRAEAERLKNRKRVVATINGSFNSGAADALISAGPAI